MTEEITRGTHTDTRHTQNLSVYLEWETNSFYRKVTRWRNRLVSSSFSRLSTEFWMYANGKLNVEQEAGVSLKDRNKIWIEWDGIQPWRFTEWVFGPAIFIGSISILNVLDILTPILFWIEKSSWLLITGVYYGSNSNFSMWRVWSSIQRSLVGGLRMKSSVHTHAKILFN